ncbi:MAG: hypothetical protein GY796_04955, partial [Chloroflexi bacterium]|nr:hypothetical protein [Chloroflexota bacterium]
MSEPHALKCPSCTASLPYDGRSETIRCDYCDTTIIVPESMQAGASRPGVVGDEEPATAEQIHKILGLVRQGKKIEAIKLYRETFDVSLKEAKDVVDHLGHGQPTAVYTTTGMGTAVATSTAASTGCGCILPILIILLILGIGVAVFFAADPEQFSRISEAIAEGDIEKAAEGVSSSVSNVNRAANGDVVATTSGGDGIGADLLLETWQYGSGNIPIRLSYTADQDGARQIVWEHQIGETGSSNQYNVGFDKQQVYLSQGTSLQAF